VNDMQLLAPVDQHRQAPHHTTSSQCGWMLKRTNTFVDLNYPDWGSNKDCGISPEVRGLSYRIRFSLTRSRRNFAFSHSDDRQPIPHCHPYNNHCISKVNIGVYDANGTAPVFGGDVSHFFRCVAPCFCFRIRDPSIRLRLFRVGHVSWLEYEPFGSYASQGGSYTTRVGRVRRRGDRIRPDC
jgi:hypothetical protein